MSCQSNSRGEPTRSEGFSFICAQILYTVQRASTSSVTRDFASQNISLRERDCHLPHGGRLRETNFNTPTNANLSHKPHHRGLHKQILPVKISTFARGGVPARQTPIYTEVKSVLLSIFPLSVSGIATRRSHTAGIMYAGSCSFRYLKASAHSSSPTKKRTILRASLS